MHSRFHFILIEFILDCSISLDLPRKVIHICEFIFNIEKHYQNFFGHFFNYNSFNFQLIIKYAI
jgi:hypothetical protein